MNESDRTTAYICETAKGQFLAKDGEDGWKFVENPYDAHWCKTKGELADIIWTNFNMDETFGKGYPLYHKVKFSYEMLTTETDDEEE